jgi:hypothetical protein
VPNPTVSDFHKMIAHAKADLDFARRRCDPMRIDLCESALNNLLERFLSHLSQVTTRDPK